MEKKFDRVMVLGGDGQIGKPLCKHLKRKNIKVYNVDLKHSPEHDLRTNANLANYWIERVDFVFFLAYDIGGSKYLETQQSQMSFMTNNMKIMNNTFEMLEKSGKPFIFASSVMAEMPWSPYGSLKRVGEHFTKTLGGITARLWNVYGPEHDEERAHVITDFIHKAKLKGKIDMLTDGTEVRQFLYAEDCSEILSTLAENYEEAHQYNVFDVSNFQWTDINAVAQIIADHYGATIVRSDKKDPVQKNSQIEPNKHPINIFWNPNKATDIKTGIHSMIKYYEENSG